MTNVGMSLVKTPTSYIGRGFYFMFSKKNWKNLENIYTQETYKECKELEGKFVMKEDFVSAHLKHCSAKGKPSLKRKCAESLFKYLVKCGVFTEKKHWKDEW